MKKPFIFLVLFFVVACSQAVNDEQQVEDQLKQTEQEEIHSVTTEAETALDKLGDDTGKVIEEIAKEIVPESTDYQAGIHYAVLNPAWDTQSDEVVVYEFFGYLCPHCYSFQPYMKGFEQRKKDNVKLVRVPVVFQPLWKIYAQAYYAAENLGILEKSHQAFFQAIHEQKKQFRTIEQIAQWFADSFGVDKDQFLSTANSFMVDGMIRKGAQMMRQMQIQSTPTLVVNGKYKPNSKQLKSRQDMINLMDYLIAKESE